jgi:hypothetical protein
LGWGQPHQGIRLKELQAQWPSTSCSPARRLLWRRHKVKRRLAKSSFRSGGALWGSIGRFLKRRLAKSGFRSGGALWGSSGRFLKRRLAKSGFQSGVALWGSSGRFLKRGLPGKLAPNNFRNRGAL